MHVPFKYAQVCCDSLFSLQRRIWGLRRVWWLCSFGIFSCASFSSCHQCVDCVAVSIFTRSLQEKRWVSLLLLIKVKLKEGRSKSVPQDVFWEKSIPPGFVLQKLLQSTQKMSVRLPGRKLTMHFYVHIAAITTIINYDLLPSGRVAQSVEERWSRGLGFDSHRVQRVFSLLRKISHLLTSTATYTTKLILWSIIWKSLLLVLCIHYELGFLYSSLVTRITCKQQTDPSG